MSWTINFISQEQEDSIVLALSNDYQTEIEDVDGAIIPNPQSQSEFALEQVKTFLQDVYRGYKVKEADSVRQTAIIDADFYTADITLIRKG
jgi:hypothetical protein